VDVVGGNVLTVCRPRPTMAEETQYCDLESVDCLQESSAALSVHLSIIEVIYYSRC